MKRRLQLMAAVLFGFAATAQVTEGTATMGAGYANQVFYKMATQTQTPFLHSSWDVSFYRKSAMEFATRVNDAKGIEVYQASASLADWGTIDVAQQTAWTRLYNSETDWKIGAFDHATATYGWGEYNFVTHHVTGAIVFVLKYADGTYKKFKIDDFFSGYTFTYSSWDGSAWTPDTTVTVANATNPTQIFNYYSLADNAPVVAEPAETDWDFLFTKYNTDLMGDGSVMYSVTGALHHPSLTVAENIEPGGTGDTSALSYAAAINAIGYDWKSFNGSSYTISTDKAFYIKNAANTIYRLVFNSFTGSSTGAITFNYEDVTALLGNETFENNVSFGIYPNPSIDKIVNIVYNAPNGNSDENEVLVYSLTGAKVFETKLATNAGFYNSEINLSHLNSGVYVLKFQSGNYSETKKLVLK